MLVVQAAQARYTGALISSKALVHAWDNVHMLPGGARCYFELRSHVASRN